MTLTLHSSVVKHSGNWTGTDIFLADSFQLSDLPNYTAFTAVWDEYRIVNIVFKFYPLLISSVASDTTVSTGVVVDIITPPSLYIANDYTDVVTPTEAILLAHEDLVFKGPMDQMITHSVKPVTLGALYQGAFTGYGREDNQWIEINSAGVSHYGTKFGIHKGYNAHGINIPYAVYCTYTLQFRKVV